MEVHEVSALLVKCTKYDYLSFMFVIFNKEERDSVGLKKITFAM